MWEEVGTTIHSENSPMLGFSEAWKDADFNPTGIRECFLNGDRTWVSAKWIDYQDCYREDECSPPTHWREFPQPPNPKAESTDTTDNTASMPFPKNCCFCPVELGDLINGCDCKYNDADCIEMVSRERHA